jgi:hypothetical protein
MTIDLTCQKCEGSFELDVHQLIEGEDKLQCPNCNAKAPADLTDDFTSALSEMIAQTANLSKKFLVSLAVESDELPGAEEEEAEDEDDDEDSDEDDDLDDDDDDLDEDEDDEEADFDEDDDR